MLYVSSVVVVVVMVVFLIWYTDMLIWVDSAISPG